MTSEQHRLRFGKYKTPRFRLGRIVTCSARGQVTICGITNGRIAWPIGKTKRARSLVLYRDLERAVRQESVTAICQWWGVCPSAVWKWRKALNVGPVNAGTSELKRLNFSRWANRAWKKSLAKAQDPDRREKIAASKRGIPRPRHVIKAMRKGRLGKPHSEVTKKKMREAHRQRLRAKSKSGEKINFS